MGLAEILQERRRTFEVISHVIRNLVTLFSAKGIEIDDELRKRMVRQIGHLQALNKGVASVQAGMKRAVNAQRKREFTTTLLLEKRSIEELVDSLAQASEKPTTEVLDRITTLLEDVKTLMLANEDRAKRST
ncbi:hypothetical protein HY496_03285 [Candidatus Woesearchaeota archaeon]|nr:hypothetical protein [Candidatus Woesearchaeota archaeon]